VIGDVIDGGAAARAGLEPGDRVLEIDGRAMRYWEEVEDAVQHAAGHELHVRVLRAGKALERYVTPLAQPVWSKERDGKMAQKGWADISYAPFAPLIGVIDAQSPAAHAGLRTGDLLISVDGQPVHNWTDVLRHLGRIGKRASVVYFRGTELPAVPQVQLMTAGFADLVPDTQVDASLRHTTYTGLEHAEMFVAHVDPGSPADTAGLRPGDLIVALDDRPLIHWMDLDQRLQAQPSRTFKLTWKRAAAGGKTETQTAELTQVWRKELDDYGHTVTRLVFGAHDDVDRSIGATVAVDGRIGYAAGKAFEMTATAIATVVGDSIQIIRGDTPSAGLGGPIDLFHAASVSGSRGWNTFFRMVALISINLGLINLLPIPMLDGGHLLVFAIEGVRRRELSPRVRGRIQLAGLVVIALITLLALHNDVIRYVLK